MVVASKANLQQQLLAEENNITHSFSGLVKLPTQPYGERCSGGGDWPDIDQSVIGQSR